MMNTITNWPKLLILFIAIWALLPKGLTSHSQDFIISSDIAGGSSVFAFPKSSSKKYASTTRNTRAKRTNVQRKTTRSKIRKQYDNLEKVATRRDKIEIIRPQDLIPREDPIKASLALTGAAQYYFNEDSVDKSIDYFREANKLDNKNDFARLGLSDALTRKGDDLLEADASQVKVAITFYQEAIAVNDENSAAYAGLGEIYDELNEPLKAIENYEKAVSIDPGLTDLNAPLGILYYQVGSVDKAEQSIAKAESFLRIAIANEPDDSQAQYFMGLIFYLQNNNKDAETSFRKSIQLESAFPDAHYYLGSTLSRISREKESIQEFLEAVKLNPRYLEARFDLGSAYFNTEQYQLSVDAYLEVVKLKNDYVEAYVNLADSYRLLAENDNTVSGKFSLLAKALSRYSMALTFIKNNPDLAKVYTEEELADIYTRYGYTAGEHNMLSSLQGFVHNWDRAIEALTSAAEIKNGPVDYANLGWAYFNSARIDLKANPDLARTKLLKGKMNLEKALTLNPNPVVLTAIRLNLGVTFIDLGDFKSAIDNLKPVTSSRSDWAFSNYSLGVAYFKNEDLNNAIDQFKKAIEKNNGYVAAYSGLGNAYLKKNDQKEVRKVIDQLKKVGTREANAEAERLRFALSLKN